MVLDKTMKVLKEIGNVLLIPMLALARHQFFSPQESHGDKHWKHKLKTRVVIGGIIILNYS